MSLLEDLVRIYSPSTEEGPAVRHLVDWMAAHGFAAWRDEVGNAVGVRGRDDAPHTLLLLGHIDTVRGEIPVRVEDGCLYGRGSVDAKGALCAFAEATAQASIPADWRVMVVGAVEEEIATSRGAYHIREQLQPDLCLIGEPSGATRVTLGYKGRLLVDIAYSQPLAHTARPEPSAGQVGVGIWQAVAEWAEAFNAGRERYFDQLFYRLAAINTEADGFAESVQLTLGFRLPPDLTPNDVLAVVLERTPGGARVTPRGAEQAYLSQKNTPLVRGMLAAIRAQGKRPAFVLKTGTSDMNVVGAAWDCPLLAYGPGDSNLDHTPHEHLPLAEYDLAVRTLRHLIEHLVALN